MKHLIVFISFFLWLFPCAAQRYNTWYFGESAGLSFNSGSGTIPYALMDGVNTITEGSASICDAKGKILFYTDGATIYNRTHQVMLNGDALLGHPSAIQSSIIIPAPGNDSIYYVFTTDGNENNFGNGYRYSMVNIKHDGGKGGVITKNVLLNASCTERLTAARHANGLDVWVIGNEKNSNVFKTWLVTSTGVQTIPVVSSLGNVLDKNNYGTMKVSPDGTQLCQTSYPHFDPGSNFLQLFDFDNATGILSNVRVINNLTNTDWGPYGCEFSPDSKLIYATIPSASFVDQFEVKLGSAAAVNASRVTIPADGGLFGIQAGPDGKIYLDHERKYLSVISSPNVKGIGCTFELDKINLENRNGKYGLPSIINDGFIHPVNPCNLVIQVSPGQTIDAGQSVQLNVTGGTSFQWSPPQWLSDPNIQNPVATPMEDIVYIVTTTDDAACKAVDSVTIHVNSIDGIYIPTGFTPGNDGRNDLLRPIMPARYKLEEFSVYNRWGQRVFSTREYGKGWDGKLNGLKQNSGIYVWFVRVTDPQNRKIERKGTIMLIR